MSARTLLPRQRQDVIQELVRTRRYATVRELASAVGVSPMTVRRDLRELQSGGRLQRVFGGAQATDPAPIRTAVPEQLHTERMTENRAAKEAIARTASRLVRDGDTVGLDGSTTAVHLARRLRARPITVVTNNLLVVAEIAGGAATVVLPGGVVREATHTVVGEMAVQGLEAFNADLVFFSCTGLDPEAGISDSNADEVAVKRALFRRSGRRVALVDASKFGRLSLLNLIDPSEVEALVTDAPPPPELAAVLDAAGTRLQVADG